MQAEALESVGMRERMKEKKPQFTNAGSSLFKIGEM